MKNLSGQVHDLLYELACAAENMAAIHQALSAGRKSRKAAADAVFAEQQRIERITGALDRIWLSIPTNQEGKA